MNFKAIHRHKSTNIVLEDTALCSRIKSSSSCANFSDFDAVWSHSTTETAYPLVI